MEVISMRKKRKQYTAEEKVAILRKHLIEKVPVSELCDEYGLQPTVFYRWQKQFFEQGAEAFRRSQDNEMVRLNQQVASWRRSWPRRTRCWAR